MQGMLLKSTKSLPNMTRGVVGERVLFEAVEMSSLVSELPEKVEKIPVEMLTPANLGMANLDLWHTPHWLESPMMQFAPFSTGRKPIGAKEWARCVWNLDVFVYRIPLLKILGLIAVAGWLL